MKIITKVLFTFIFIILNLQLVFAQWAPTSLNKSGKTFCRPTNQNFVLTGGDLGIIYKTTNSGDSWIGVDTLHASIYCITQNTTSGYQTNLYAGTAKGLWKSTNSGSTWDSVGFGDKSIYTVVAANNIIMFGIDSGIYRSTNNGANWIYYILGKKVNTICYGEYGSEYYAGTVYGIWETTNGGTNWNWQSSTASHNINIIAYVNSYIIIGSNRGFFWKGPNGWPNAGETSYPVYSITSNGSGYCLLGKNGRITRYKCGNGSVLGLLDSTDKSQGLPPGENPVTALLGLGTGNYRLAGFNNMGPENNVWRANDAYVDVKKISSEVLSTYELEQNYPNPFNPSTTIRYQISKPEVIILKVYDVAGKELETLVNEKHSPGTYEVTWNASKYSSGTYFYKIETESFTDTKRMLLIK